MSAIVKRRRIRLVKRHSKLTQLDTSIARYRKRRKPMLHFENERPNKWTLLIKFGRI